VLGFGTVRHLDDRLDDTKKRLELFLKMHAIKKVFQEENQLLSFDHIIRRLPLTEKFMVATEATCLAFFASLEEVVFPTMHKLVSRREPFRRRPRLFLFSRFRPIQR
jgi:hypothetical protein